MHDKTSALLDVKNSNQTKQSVYTLVESLKYKSLVICSKNLREIAKTGLK